MNIQNKPCLEICMQWPLTYLLSIFARINNIHSPVLPYRHFNITGKKSHLFEYDYPFRLWVFLGQNPVWILNTPVAHFGLIHSPALMHSKSFSSSGRCPLWMNLHNLAWWAHSHSQSIPCLVFVNCCGHFLWQFEVTWTRWHSHSVWFIKDLVWTKWSPLGNTLPSWPGTVSNTKNAFVIILIPSSFFGPHTSPLGQQPV